MAKTGVKECDEFIDLLSNDSKSPDEDFITRKIREYAIDFAKESIKKNIEENQNDKEKIAQGCKEARDEYLRKKTEDAKGGNSNR
jgi:DNA transposition AAA+ family ATPase